MPLTAGAWHCSRGFLCTPNELYELHAVQVEVHVQIRLCRLVVVQDEIRGVLLQERIHRVDAAGHHVLPYGLPHCQRRCGGTLGLTATASSHRSRHCHMKRLETWGTYKNQRAGLNLSRQGRRKCNMLAVPQEECMAEPLFQCFKLTWPGFA